MNNFLSPQSCLLQDYRTIGVAGRERGGYGIQICVSPIPLSESMGTCQRDLYEIACTCPRLLEGFRSLLIREEPGLGLPPFEIDVDDTKRIFHKKIQKFRSVSIGVE
ncbi:hypothetical protein CEXT_581711 [Caerostris extrusa]|uniref:Uncharacterized protein n=1 Tax=Caerostris extrusa TaxID=172846 RepID=A0AAV4TY22_CAEEX|nr:hypothetical protein CEXT_581711 [Caerostris extrusa]